MRVENTKAIGLKHFCLVAGKTYAKLGTGSSKFNSFVSRYFTVFKLLFINSCAYNIYAMMKYSRNVFEPRFEDAVTVCDVSGVQILGIW